MTNDVDIATQRVVSLLDPDRCARVAHTTSGVVDVLADEGTRIQGPAQWLMRARAYSKIYQLGRPLAVRVASGLTSAGRDGDRRRVAESLCLSPGSVVLDVACGPGNFTGSFGSVVGPTGLAIGLDASWAMLEQAVTTNSGSSVAYLHGDAENLPFQDNSVDAVSCLLALYLINDPHRAVREMARVLRPGGRVAILTSYPGSSLPSRALMNLVGKVGGVTMFGADAITSSLARSGFTDITSELAGFTQTASATRT